MLLRCCAADTDPGINSFVTQHKYMDYFDSLGVNESEPWRPWTLDGKQRMGGYVVTWPGNLHYLTIRGSGHMVCQSQSEFGFACLALVPRCGIKVALTEVVSA